MLRSAQGQANLTAVFLLLGVVISAVWVWKRLTPEQQDWVVDQAIPLVAATLLTAAVIGLVVRSLRRRRTQRQQRAELLDLFERATARDKKLEIAFALIEVNGYRVEGLEPAVPAMKELFTTTLQRALGDKQHRIRGMAASHLGVLQDPSLAPLLVKALEDDHAYVRACAALGLGRLRATETRDRLKTVMEEDWDQTVRSRAKEALERMRG